MVLSFDHMNKQVFFLFLLRRCLMSILADFYTADIISDPKYKFSHSGNYFAPPKGTYDEYVEFIKVKTGGEGVAVGDDDNDGDDVDDDGEGDDDDGVGDEMMIMMIMVVVVVMKMMMMMMVVVVMMVLVMR